MKYAVREVVKWGVVTLSVTARVLPAGGLGYGGVEYVRLKDDGDAGTRSYRVGRYLGRSPRLRPTLAG